MATNGSFKITQQRGYIYLYLNVSWERTSYSLAENTSTITWTATISATTYNGIQGNATYQLNINDEYVGFGGTHTGTNPLSGTYTVSHDDFEAANLVFSGKLDKDFSPQSYKVDAPRKQANIITASNFTDEENPIITYSNPLGSEVTELRGYISWGSGNRYIYHDLPTNATEYEFVLTDSDREALRRGVSTGSSLPVTFYIETDFGSDTYSSGTIGRTMTLINYKPILNPSVTDSNTTTVNLTGNKNKLIKYFSTASFNTGATAIKGATIDYQTIINGSVKLKDYTSNTGNIPYTDSNTFYFSVTDSRGHTTNKSLVKSVDRGEFIEYVKLTSALTLDYLTLAGEVGLTVKGNYFNSSFGAQNNYLTFKYFLIEDGSEIGTFGMNPTVTYDGNTYTATYTITGLDPDSSYEVYVDVTDALMHVQSNAEAISATPIFDWGKNDFNHNTDVYLKQGKSIKTHNSSGYETEVLGTNDSSDSIALGWGNYDNEQGSTEIYGNLVSVQSRNGLLINGREYGKNKILWSGASPLGQYHTATLSENISAQPHGVVLVFSLYQENPDTMRWEPKDVSIHSFFVSKQEVAALPNAPHTFFLMINSGFSLIGSKYVYIDDKVLSGHATNTTNSSNNGFTFKNNNFVLRYVIGV